MLLIIWYKKPFNEPVLNYTNVLTELLLAVIFFLLFFFSFDNSESVENQIDLALIVLVNIIIGVQILGSLVISCKLVREIIKRRTSQKVASISEGKLGYNVQVASIEIEKSENEEDNIVIYNQLHPTPVYSIRNSFVTEHDFRDDRIQSNYMQDFEDRKYLKSESEFNNPKDRISNYSRKNLEK